MQSKNIFIQAILFLKYPLLFSGIKWLIKKNLKNCQSIDFIPGFRYLFGNICAKKSFLCDTFFMDYDKITIGEKTMFSYGNIVITSKHDIGDRREILTAPIVIGKNVWITTRCVILGGVTIGDNSIIGPLSVVTKDIPPNCLAAGNPAKVIKYYNYKKK